MVHANVLTLATCVISISHALSIPKTLEGVHYQRYQKPFTTDNENGDALTKVNSIPTTDSDNLNDSNQRPNPTVAPKNLLGNGDFETGNMYEWNCQTENQATCKVSISRPSQGTFRLQSVQKAGVTSNNGAHYDYSSAELSQWVAAEPGRDYYLSFDYVFEEQDKSTNGGNILVRVDDEQVLGNIHQRDSAATWNTACFAWTAGHGDGRLSILMSQLSNTGGIEIGIDDMVLSTEPTPACNG